MADHLGAGQILPMHWNTFIQTEHEQNKPIEKTEKSDRQMSPAGSRWSR